MRYLLLVFSLLLSIGIGTAQTKLTKKMNFDLARKVHDPSMQNQTVPVLVQGDVQKTTGIIRMLNGFIKGRSGNILSVNIKIKELSKLADMSYVYRIEAYDPHPVLMNDSMRVKANVNPVHAGQTPLTQAYDGSGVVVGFIDSGLDFNHPDFKNSSGKTRVQYIWDHKKPNAANTPTPYNYGQEWDSVAINAGNCTHNDTIVYGHGTLSAGTAAGNGTALPQYKGVAPMSDLICVALDFNNPHPNQNADAAEYIYTKADVLGKPCVINASEGEYYGSHDGKNLEAQYIKGLINAKPGRAFVGAAGNAGGYKIHLGYDVSAADTNFTWFGKDLAFGAVYMGCYGDSASIVNVKFAVGCDMFSPYYLFRGMTPMQAVSAKAFQTLLTDTLKNVDNQRMGIIQSYVDKVNGTYSMEFFIIPDSSYSKYLYRLAATGTGRFDCWYTPQPAVIKWLNLPDSTTYPPMADYKYPDTLQSIVSSFQCLDEVITVGNYNNKKYYYDIDGIRQDTVCCAPATPGTISASSSRGPTRDGRIKPDIAAPGVWTISTFDLYVANQWLTFAPGRKKLVPGAQYSRAGGTSIASPVVAGIAALYLQKNPTATGLQVKNAIVNCAFADANTGTVPNYTWGYGKVDAFGALTGCSTSVAVIENTGMLSIFPNPFKEETTIQYDFSSAANFMNAQLRIYDVVGKLVRIVDLKERSNTLQLHKNDLQSGSYIYNLIINDNVVKSDKIMIL